MEIVFTYSLVCWCCAIDLFIKIVRLPTCKQLDYAQCFKSKGKIYGSKHTAYKNIVNYISHANICFHINFVYVSETQIEKKIHQVRIKKYEIEHLLNHTLSWWNIERHISSNSPCLHSLNSLCIWKFIVLMCTINEIQDNCFELLCVSIKMILTPIEW